MRDVELWILDCLLRVNMGPSGYFPWCVVTGQPHVRGEPDTDDDDDDAADDADDEAPPFAHTAPMEVPPFAHTAPEDGSVVDGPAVFADADDTRFREVVMLIHVGVASGPYYSHITAEDGLLVAEERPYRQCTEVHADKLRDVLLASSAPPCVHEVGISCVSDEFMMDQWFDVIRGGRRARGKGVLEHPMWRVDFQDSVLRLVQMPEASLYFSWKGYRAIHEMVRYFTGH